MLAETVNNLRCAALETSDTVHRKVPVSGIIEKTLQRFRDGHGHGPGTEDLEIPMPSKDTVLERISVECGRWSEIELRENHVCFEVSAPRSPFD